MKYKLLLIVALLLFLGCLCNNNGQQISDEEKQKIIKLLEEPDSSKSLFAIEEVMKYNLTEAITQILENLWKQDPFVQYRFIVALSQLNYDDTKQLLYAYMDSLDHHDFLHTTFTPLELKSLAVGSLITLGDYSRRQFLYDYIDKMPANLGENEIYALINILEKFPQDESNARERLMREAVDCSDSNLRWYILHALNEFYGEHLITFFMQREAEENDWGNKLMIINYILANYQLNSVHEFISSRILIEPTDRLNVEMAKVLLAQYGSPPDLELVKRLQKILVDEIYKPFLDNIVLDEFIVHEPSDGMNVTTILDSLQSYYKACYSFNWLGNPNFFTQLQTLINDAQSKLAGGDSLGSAIKIKQYQSLINQAYKDSTTERYVTSDGYKFLYYYPQYILERLPKIPTVKLKSSTGTLLSGGSLQYYEGGWKDAIDNGDGTFALPVSPKTLSLRMTYAFGSQTKSNVTVGTDTVVFQTVNAKVQLQNSLGAAVDTGKVQYYSGAWREFGTTVNGTASKELMPGNYSFRMSYAYASTDKAQDISVNPNVVFQTVNVNVQLQNSSGNLIDQGTVQYYSGAWREFGVTANGTTTKELLPNNYSFRMTYAYASTDKQQDLKTNPTVVFQTVNAQVQLKNSLGNLIDQGTVQYYSGAWREFGATTNGIASKELLPNNYSFRITYAYASADKQQDLKTNPTVVFQTVNAQVQLKNSLGNLIDAGTVQYYSGAWRDFGATTNGIASRELLPNNYSFRMTYAYASTDKQQDLKTNPTVVFQTVNAQVQLKNSLGNLMDQGTVQYYSGAWREFGTTVNGTATKELLPNNYSFRMTHEYISKDISQNVGANNIVNFSTVLCTIRAKDAQGNPLNNALVSYYSGAWRQIGLTVNGEITKELLPANITFRVNYNSTQKDKAQDITTNNIVEFGF